MRFMAVIATLASWLMISTFAFAQSGASFLLAWTTSLVVSAASMASSGRIWIRFVITAASFVLFWSALLLPDVSAAARTSNALVGALLFAISVIPTPSRAGQAS